MEINGVAALQIENNNINTIVNYDATIQTDLERKSIFAASNRIRCLLNLFYKLFDLVLEFLEN